MFDPFKQAKLQNAYQSMKEYNPVPEKDMKLDELKRLSGSGKITGESTAPIDTQEEFSFIIQLEREPFTSVTYEYLITVATTGTNQDIYASIEWQEVT
jgi:hypothetical protein